MTTLGILTAARELLSDEARWTRGVASKSTIEGQDAPNCWCWLGAVWHVGGGAIKGDTWNAEGIMTAVVRNLGFDNIVTFNDHPATTHAMVLAAFDRATEKARADG